MRLATQFDRIHGAGAEIIAVSVDDDVRQVAMSRRWGLESMRFVADPGGSRYLRSLDLFDPNERDGVALPSLVLIGPDGIEHFRHVSRDFADRINDDDILDALETLRLPSIQAPDWTSNVDVPAGLQGFYRSENLWPYMRGNFFAAVAISRRLERAGADADAVAVAEEHQLMATSMGDAVRAWKANFEN